MSEIVKRKIISIGTLAVIAITAALLIELISNIPLLSLPSEQKGKHQLTFSETQFGADSIIEGSADGEIIYRSRSEYENYVGMKAYYSNAESYVGKLLLSYEATSAAYFDIIVVYENMFGYIESKVIKDANPIYMNQSVVTVGEKVRDIWIIPVKNSTPELENEVDVLSVSYENRPVFNHFRLIFVIMLLVSMGLLIIFRKLISEKFEYAFLIVSICAGFIFCLAMPLSRVVWDEESHMRGVYWLDITGDYEYNRFLQNYIDGSYENLPFEYSMSYEEYAMVYETVNRLSTPSAEDPVTVHPWGTSGFATFSYVFMAITCNICKLLGSPFGLTYILVRFTNLVMYIIVIFFALRKIPKGKMLMSAIALMPTPMFIASTVSYDTIVTGFLFLGMAYMFYMMYSEKPSTWWEYLVFIGSMCYASSKKTIYIPLILLGLFIPQRAFRDKKTEKIMRVGMVVAFLLMMSTFVLPALFNPSVEGDLRGGTTSHAGQISNIFGHPFAYAGLLLSNIWAKLFEYGIGTATLDFLAYLGAGSLSYLIVIYLVSLTLTSENSEYVLNEKGRKECKDMKLWLRTAIFVLVFGVICLIWTSMFMSYTEVGKTAMAGVHGRYYVPLLFPVLFALSFNRIKVDYDRVKYSLCAALMSAFILFYTIWEVLLSKCSL